MSDNHFEPTVDFDSEHAKRDRRISEQQRREWADDLMSCLPDSAGYQDACTPHARLKEQALLNQIVEDWKASQLRNESDFSRDR